MPFSAISALGTRKVGRFRQHNGKRLLRRRRPTGRDPIPQRPARRRRHHLRRRPGPRKRANFRSRLALLRSSDVSQYGLLASLCAFEAEYRSILRRGGNIMNDLKTIRTDVVGSLLRPAALKDARTRFDDGQISADDLRKLEDDAVRIAVLLQ